MKTRLTRPEVISHPIKDILAEFHTIIFHGIDGKEKLAQYLSLEEKEVIASVLAIYYICDKCHGYHRRALLKTLCNQSLTEEQIKKIATHLLRLDLSLRLQLDLMSPDEKVLWMNLWEPLAKKIDRYFTPGASNLAGYAIAIARNDKTLMRYCMERLAQQYAKSEQSFIGMIGEIISLTAYMKCSITINRTLSTVEYDLQNIQTKYFTDS